MWLIKPHVNRDWQWTERKSPAFFCLSPACSAEEPCGTVPRNFCPFRKIFGSIRIFGTRSVSGSDDVLEISGKLRIFQMISVFVWYLVVSSLLTWDSRVSCFTCKLYLFLWKHFYWLRFVKDLLKYYAL